VWLTSFALPVTLPLALSSIPLLCVVSAALTLALAASLISLAPVTFALASLETTLRRVYVVCPHIPLSKVSIF
jgi:hypothetical protein